MEHTTFTQMHQNPSYPPDPNAQNPPNAYQYQHHYYPQYTNPSPNYAQNPYTYQNQDPTQVQQPVVDPYNPGQYGYTYQQTADGSMAASSTYYQCAGNTSSLQTADGSLATSSTYYQNAGALMANGSVSVNQYAVNPNTWDVNTGTYQNNQPQNRCKWKKAPKVTKVVQSARCDICHIKCDTNDVFELHKQGKKHKKNLDKLRNAAAIVAINSFNAPVPALTGIQRPTAAPISASTSGVAPSDVPMIGPQENPNNKASKASKKKKRSKESQENLEMKKQKILEGGAAAEAVRTCSVCNVVCNSDTVYSYHLAGQKHAAMVKKLAPLTTVTATNCR